MACTSPRRTVSSMSLLATTPGKRLVMPRSSTAYGTPSGALPPGGPATLPAGASVEAIGVLPRSRPPRGARRSAVRCRRHGIDRPRRKAWCCGGMIPQPPSGRARGARPGPRRRVPGPAPPDPPSGVPGGAGGVPAPAGSRRVRHRDLAADDLLLVLVDLTLDVVDEATGGGQADAVALQVVGDVGAALDAAVDEVADVGLDGVVDPLEHRGHDHRLQGGVPDGVVLVGVDADRPLAGVLGRPEDAETRAAGRVVHDVRALVVHALGDDLALGR